MEQLALGIALLALIVGVAAFIRMGSVFRGGIVTTTVPVEMPVVIFLYDVDSTSKCSQKEFGGYVELELIYLGLGGRPPAEVKITLGIRRKDNVTVSLDQTDLGIFRSDVTKTVRFTGELTNPCDDGEFLVIATIENQGPGSTTMAETVTVDIEAQDYSVTMPTRVQTTDGIRFSFDIDIACCGPGLEHTIIFANIADVTNLAAAPLSFECADAADRDTVTITGRKADVNRVGTFTVKADTIIGDCVLGSVMVE